MCSKREAAKRAARLLSLNRAATVWTGWKNQKMAHLKGQMLFVGFLTMQTTVEGKIPTFRVNAGSFVDAGYKKVIWGGELQSDVTIIEVTARLHRMVKTLMDIDTDRVSIEIKTGLDVDGDVILQIPNKHDFCKSLGIREGIKDLYGIRRYGGGGRKLFCHLPLQELKLESDV